MKLFATQAFASLILTLALAPPRVVLAQDRPSASDEAERLTESIEVLQDLVRVPEDAIPQYIMERAEAVVIVPTLVKGGFVIGAEHGRGVMSVRDRATNTWSAPAFVALTGGTVGWQIGLQSTDLVLVVMNRDGVSDLLKSQFTLGATASVAAGPVGRTAEASTDARAGAKILAYSRAKGLFAGATIEGSSLRIDEKANERFYGRALTPEAIFALSPTAMPAGASQLARDLAQIAGPSTAPR